MNHVRAEVLGWRDQRYSRRHRKWGTACACCDLDSTVMVEYNFGTPVCLLELKHINGLGNVDLGHPSIRAVEKLADGCAIPALLVFYDPVQWWFLVQPLNRVARSMVRKPVIVSEVQFVRALYKLRNLKLPLSVAANLNTFVPTDAKKKLRKVA